VARDTLNHTEKEGNKQRQRKKLKETEENRSEIYTSHEVKGRDSCRENCIE